MFANGQTSFCNKEVSTYLQIGLYHENVNLKVAPLPKHDIILGKPWLERWNPNVNWRTNEITFRFNDRDVTIKPQGLQLLAVEDHNSPLPVKDLSANHDLTTPEPARLQPDQQQMTDSGPMFNIQEASTRSETGSANKTTTPQITVITAQEAKQAIQQGNEVFVLTISETKELLEIPDERVRALLAEFSDVFPEKLPAELPPPRDVDHRIELEPGSVPPSRPIYRMSPLELDELRKQLDELITNGYIQPSRSHPFCQEKKWRTPNVR